MIRKISILVFALCLMGLSVQAQGRLLRKLQEKTEEKIVNEILGEPDKTEQNQNNPNHDESDGVKNRRGSGLSQDAPDVAANIEEAEKHFDAQRYIQAKSSVKNALWGVELEIGKKVLESLPKEVVNLNVQDDDDKVSSTGVGFVGLVIERTYQGEDDIQLQATIGNDSALLGMAGFYMVDGTYMQSTDQPDQKQVQFKDHRAVIRYDEYDGYTLSVPFGQTSIFIVNGVNFENETDFMAAANCFDLSDIKSKLGVQ